MEEFSSWVDIKVVMSRAVFSFRGRICNVLKFLLFTIGILKTLKVKVDPKAHIDGGYMLLN